MYQRLHSSQLHMPYTITEGPTAWTVPCWDVGWMNSLGCLLTWTCPYSRFNLKRDWSDQATCFKSLTVQWRCWLAQARRKALCRAVKNGTRVAHIMAHGKWLIFWKPISMTCHCKVHSLTLIHVSVLKFVSNLKKRCTSITFKDCNPAVPAVLSEILSFTGYLIFRIHSWNDRAQKSKLHCYFRDAETYHYNAQSHLNLYNLPL